MKRFIEAIKQGRQEYGFSTRKTWKNKPYFDAGYVYYDGHNYYFHLWIFYWGVSPEHFYEKQRTKHE